jgi:hypothetical protein
MKTYFFLFLLIIFYRVGTSQVDVITVKKETSCDFVFVASDSLIGKTKRFEGFVISGDIKKRTAEKIRKEIKFVREQVFLITRENFALQISGVCEVDKQHLKKLVVKCNQETGKIRVLFYYEKTTPKKHEPM